MLAPRALILRAPGTNCDHETAFAFERAGGLARRMHVRALAEKPAAADDFQILCIPGGFSYGDDIASGRIFALEIRTRLADALVRFRDRGASCSASATASRCFSRPVCCSPTPRPVPRWHRWRTTARADSWTAG